jgi:ribosomal subunit interface protein
MVVDVRAHNFRLTDAIVRHVEARVAAALGWASQSIVNVVVRLDDVNGGHRGTSDKLCRIVTQVRGLSSVVAEFMHQDLYAAIDEAVARARHGLSKQVGRRLTRRQHPAELHLSRERW